jgi:hypothetical protein
MDDDGPSARVPSHRVPTTLATKDDYDFINNLPPWEVINKFNLKSKYFDSDVYPGSNRIKTQIEPKFNPNTFHYDNIMAVIVDPDTQSFFKSGQLDIIPTTNLFPKTPT